MIDFNDYYYFVYVVEKKGFFVVGQVLGVLILWLSWYIV